MKILKINCLVALLLFLNHFLMIPGTAVSGQPGNRITTEEYIDKYRKAAINDMKLTGVPASITLAQGILESSSGNSRLAREANNHFGIKCHNDWNGARIYKDDDRRNECFRKYEDVMASFNDHSRFLRERSRYAFLFDYKTTDYKAWAKGLKKAGYATNPKYASHLIRIIEQHELYQYDKGGTRVPLDQKVKYPESRQDMEMAATKPVKTAGSKSSVSYNHNEVPFIISKQGDTYYSLAVRHDLRLWQILKYNDAQRGDILSVNEIIYLKPKRGRAEQPTHLIKQGETARSVAQLYGIKVRKLNKMNGLEPGEFPLPGNSIKLR